MNGRKVVLFDGAVVLVEKVVSKTFVVVLFGLEIVVENISVVLVAVEACSKWGVDAFRKNKKVFVILNKKLFYKFIQFNLIYEWN